MSQRVRAGLGGAQDQHVHGAPRLPECADLIRGEAFESQCETGEVDSLRTGTGVFSPHAEQIAARETGQRFLAVA
jgi:hypothetical protein